MKNDVFSDAVNYYYDIHGYVDASFVASIISLPINIVKEKLNQCGFVECIRGKFVKKYEKEKK